MTRRRAQLSDFVNAYTPAHVAAGVLLGFGRVPWWAALGLAVGWEAVEHPIKDAYPKLIGEQDTVAGSAGDVLGVMLGWGIARVLM